MSNTKLLLSRIFASINQTKDIVEEDDVMSKLVQLASLELQDLRQFTQCLQKDCGQSPQALLKIYTQLLSNQETRILLGQRLLRQWLIFKIFQSLDIFKKSERKKRDKVNSVLRSFEFSGKALVDLVVACSSSAEIELSEEDVKEMVDSLREQNAQIDQAFRSLERPFEIQYNPNKSIFEHLNDLISDYKIIPKESLEKELQKELILAYILKNSLGTEIISQSLPELLQQRQSVVGLKKHYEKEFGPTPPQIEEIFKRLKEGEESTLYQNLYFLKFKIFSLNVLQLIRLINKTKESERLIARKEVILFIGNTGSGKSTLILKFLGYNLMHGVYNKLSTLVPKEKLKEQHKSFYTSPEAKSCTRYINAVPVPDEIYPAGTPKIKKNLVVCDSPGFGDSAGVQVDIANGVGMINALHQASSVRLVVILPFDSLTSNRMEGAIKISEIISNLFHQLTVIESIAILFNKVPKQKIREIPQMIQSKITNMTEVQRSNQKLCILLNKILLSSKQEKNYLDPLKQGFNEIFNRIQSMQPINQVKRFQYQFTDATKKDIENFVQSQRNLIKKYCQSGRLSHSYFHFKNLRQLKGILRTNSKLIQCYSQLVKFIQQLSTNWFTLYEDLINQIIKYQSSNSEKLRQVNLKIRQLHKLFKEFEDLRTVSNEQVDKMIEEKKKLIHNRLQKIEEVSQQMITTVKVFSQELDSKFEKAFADKLDESFKQIYFQTQKLLKRKQYSEAAKSLSNLNRLESLIRLTSAPISKERQMIKLKKDLLSTVKNGFDLLTEVEKQQFIKQATVRKANESIQQIQQIIELSFLDDNDQFKKEFNQKLKNIQTKCKKGIRQIENLNVSLQNDDPKIFSINNQLKKKKNQVQLFMKIGDQRQRLKQDFDYAISNIARKLKQNVQIVTNFITALQGNKIDQLYKNLDRIKKAKNIIIQCSKIVDDDENNYIQLAESIQIQFIKYIKGQILSLNNFDLKLTQMTQQNLKKLSNFHEKISIYVKMGIVEKSTNIDSNIHNIIEELQRKFYQKIINPYKQFQSQQLFLLTEKNHYSCLYSILQKFEKLALYSLKIEEILEIQLYSKIKEKQKHIVSVLQNIYNQLSLKVQQFKKIQNQEQNPEYIKQLIKILVTQNLKQYSCQYLSSKINFQLKQVLGTIEQKLLQIKNNLEKNIDFSNIKKIKTDCRFYSEIQDIYKYKGFNQKFGFKNLQKFVQKQYIKSLNSDSDKITQITSGKPSQIAINQLKNLYDKFKKLNNEEGNQKIALIKMQLSAIDHRIFESLKRHKNEMEDPSFISDKKKLDEFLETFYQAIELKSKLKILYTQQQDSKNLITQSSFKTIISKIYTVYEADYKNIIQAMADYNLDKLQDKLNTFGLLENMIFEFFSLEKYDFQSNQQQTKDQSERNLFIFIKHEAQSLKKQIQTHKYISLSQKNTSKTRKKLKHLLQFIRIGSQIQTKQKYGKSDNFVIDNELKKYYIHSQAIKREQLQENIESYFKCQFDEYSKKCHQSSDQAAIFSQDIEKKINLLPNKLKQKYMKNFSQLKKQLGQKDIQQIKNTIQAIIKSPKNIVMFSDLFEKASNKVQFCNKLVSAFPSIYQRLKQPIQTVQQTINLIQIYLIDVYHNNEKYKPKISQIFVIMEKQLEVLMKQLKKMGQNQLASLKCFFQDSNKRQDGNNSEKQIANIFKIICLIIKNKGINLSQGINKLQQDIITQFQQKISNIFVIYSQKVLNKPEFELTSKQILESKKASKYQSYFSYLKLKSQAIASIKNHNQENKMNLERLQNIENQAILKFYQDQINQMIVFLNTFDFFDEIKRSMTISDMEKDFKALDLYYEILEKKQQFFKLYVIQQRENKYDFEKMAKSLQNKFDEHFEEGKIQIKQNFYKLHSCNLGRINLLISQLKLLKNNEKGFKFISSEKTKRLFEELGKIIKSEFDSVKQRCKSTYNSLKQKNNEVSYCQQKELQKMNKQLAELKKSKKQQSQTKINQKIMYYKDLLSKQSDNQRKKQLQNKKKGQIQSLQNEFQKQCISAIEKIQLAYKQQLYNLNKQISQFVNAFCLNLMLFQKSIIDIQAQAYHYKKSFQTILQQVQQDGRLIKLIEENLSSNILDQRSIGQYIIENYKVFGNFKINKIRNMMKEQDIKYVLKNLKIITQEDKIPMKPHQLQTINNIYKLFIQKYQSYKNRYRKNPLQTTVNLIVSELREIGLYLKDKFYQNSNPIKECQIKIGLLAGIFALWAILKSLVYQGEIQFIMEPHPSQITALTLLLGFSHSQQKIANRLAQIGTGEGKSIVLAGMSCYLALVGFKVMSACYSSYLSQRDSQTFIILFEKLKVQKSIKYGTFNQICQSILNNDDVFLKDEIKNMILADKNKFSTLISNFSFVKKVKQDPNILIIDEIDVFFQDSFFGNTYCPAFKLVGQTVNNFLKFVWKQVKNKGYQTNYKQIKQNSAFRKLVSSFPTLEQLLQNQINGIILGALNYQHEYLIIDKKIVYKDNDSVSTKVNYGYKTVFANIYQHERQKVSIANLNESLQISLMIAEFSYAILPSYFKNILGVTGTLEVLPKEKKKELVDRYDIKEKYAIPSPFGINQKRSQKYFIIPKDSFHYLQIINRIKEVDNNRPILVFFKGQNQLYQFFNYAEYSDYLKRTFTITEQHQPSTRDSRIIKAVNSGNITLISSAFGRGTDFIVLDKKTNQKGGLHVIQTFLSVQESQEIQIKGRTARQNATGSYDCVINQNELEKLQLSANQFKKQNSEEIHRRLKQARQKKSQKLFENTRNMIQKANQKHNKAVQLFKKPNMSQKQLIQHVLNLNRYPDYHPSINKTVLALDATGSMSSALKKTCEIIGTTFQRSIQVLKQRNVQTTVEIQIKLYRNYNTQHNQIIQSTTFESTPVHLRQFLSKVQPKGGLGNEALQVLFQSLNKESQINQVILIGDAPPNTIQEVNDKRKKNHGQQYWLKHGYPKTNIKQQLSYFNTKHKKCPVHSFYLNNGEGFKEISSQTKGTCQPFRINSQEVTQQLQDFVIENILKSIQQAKDVQNLVDDYRRMYHKN